jgi:hypothetical protein
MSRAQVVPVIAAGVQLCKDMSYVPLWLLRVRQAGKHTGLVLCRVQPKNRLV